MAYVVSFPGGVKVDVKSPSGHVISTDQPVEAGGQDSAPQPFEVFLASIAACAGFYALRFCQQRSISTDGLKIALDVRRKPEKKGISDVDISVVVPDGFPLKYRDALLASIESCAVKKNILDPPAFHMSLVN
ncbi:MAG: OsmC family protein [Candidatus Altiarchaeota archaeon]|nr:OsmC family protein [Candidatus Altiarchaeota archaeon]